MKCLSKKIIMPICMKQINRGDWVELYNTVKLTVI